MAKYIEREVLITKIKENAMTKFDWSETIDIDDLKQVIQDVPTADVVEVVRCKDCEYWQDKNSKSTQGVCLCGEKNMNYGGEFYPFANDFCSYGTPKERGGEK